MADNDRGTLSSVVWNRSGFPRGFDEPTYYHLTTDATRTFCGLLIPLFPRGQSPRFDPAERADCPRCLNSKKNKADE